MSRGTDKKQGTKTSSQNARNVEHCEDASTSYAEQNKHPLFCADGMMRNEAMSTRDLQELCFEASYFQDKLELCRLIPSRFHFQIRFDINALSPQVATAPPQLEYDIKRLGSRQGRSTQRWVFDSLNKRKIRLVTGCVPILKDGRILTISASKKSGWILPKGGWECDESMEESAVRECYEEAGITGFLGSRLSEVTFESRKAKKQLLSLKQHICLDERGPLKASSNCGPPKTSKWTADRGGEFSSSGSDLSQLSDETSLGYHENGGVLSLSHYRVVPSEVDLFENDEIDATFKPVTTNVEHAEFTVPTLPIVSPRQPSFAEASSSNSGFFYTHIQMVLFPLYVSEVHDDWPECGRLRKAISIDEALAILSSRPEFACSLVEVKEKGLHLHPA